MSEVSLRELLPDKLGEIAEIIGVESALKLSESFPGIRIFIPRNVRGSSPIVAAIGIQAARKLARHYEGEAIVVPMARKVHQLRLKATVLRLLAEGAAAKTPAERKRLSAAALARKYGLHQFTIYRWSAESMSTAQMGLFPTSI